MVRRSGQRATHSYLHATQCYSATLQRVAHPVATCCVLFVADFIPKDSPAYGMVMRARMAALADKMQREQAAIAAGHAKVGAAFCGTSLPLIPCNFVPHPRNRVLLPLCATSMPALLAGRRITTTR